MRFLLLFLILFSSVAWFTAEASAQAEPPPSTFCRFVPERSDDFAWENDLLAFRVYGPALKKGKEDSGIDCWAKRVTYPIVDKWYRLHREEKQSYHQDRGEGADFYHVGSSSGCGGTAIWHQGEMVLSNVFEDWKIISQEPERTVFQLTYEYTFQGRSIREEKTITIELGKRLFQSESVFTEGGKPVDLEIAVGVTTHDQKGTATMDREKGWMLVWENFRNNGELGTGVVMEPGRITGMEEIKSDKRDESHVILTTRTDKDGRTRHYAGYGWNKAGAITTPQQWAEYLAAFAASLNPTNGG